MVIGGAGHSLNFGFFGRSTGTVAVLICTVGLNTTCTRPVRRDIAECMGTQMFGHLRV